MKSRAVLCATLVAAFGVSSLSFAQGYDRRGDPRGGGDRGAYSQRDRGDRGDRGDRRPQQRAPRGPQDSRPMGNRDSRGDWDSRRGEYGYSYGARGPEWHRGGRVPPEYRHRQYVVDNWRAHHLSPPPRGYYWVQVGSDYVLVAIATGIIAQLILSQ